MFRACPTHQSGEQQKTETHADRLTEAPHEDIDDINEADRFFRGLAFAIPPSLVIWYGAFKVSSFLWRLIS